MRTFKIALFSVLVGKLTFATVLGTSAPLGTGTRTESSQLVTGGNYALDSDTFQIDWNITFGSGFFTYQYTFSGFDKPGISHIILMLSENCQEATKQTECVQSVGTGFNTEFGTFGPAPSNPGFPSSQSIVGIKFNVTGDGKSGTILQFNSLRAPMWGNIYLKGGKDSFVYNLGLANPGSNNTSDFIPVPDTTSAVIPEPSSVLLLGTALGWSALVIRQRKR